MPSPEINQFLSWFKSHNGDVDLSLMDVIDFPLSEGGRGAVAIQDIPEGHLVFSIPRSLVLSTRTSKLTSIFGEEAWKHFGLHRGWSGLILCMLWEAAKGKESKWLPYFDILPTKFDTPMLWSEEELLELKGTSVVDKLGKSEAEKDYAEKLLPAIQSRPDLFASENISRAFSLDCYHVMGTRILSRSFTLEKTDEREENRMDVDTDAEDEGRHLQTEANSEEQEDDNASENRDEDGEDDLQEVAMVPLADILNARYKCSNVKLFQEHDSLKMIATRFIKAGEQIWNTYGDLPNSDLLRNYGHVDLIPFKMPGIDEVLHGNPGDIVELKADVVTTVLHVDRNAKIDDFEERIDWWLEEGGDDIFVLELTPSTSVQAPLQLEPPTLPDPLLAFIRLLMNDDEWERAKSKGKPPKPKADSETLQIVSASLRRLAEAYDTDLVQDEEIFKSISLMNVNKRHAAIVRLGEKRVLQAFKTLVEEKLKALVDEENGKKAKLKTKISTNGGKRGREGSFGAGVGGHVKKRRKR